MKRAPHVDTGTSSYVELYTAAALRAELGHPELVPGSHDPSDAELRTYVREVLAERGTAARVGPEHLVALYLRGLLVPVERWWLVWQRVMVETVRRQQVADELAREAERRWPADEGDEPEPPAEVPEVTGEAYGPGPDEADDEPLALRLGLLVDERPLRPEADERKRAGRNPD